MLAVDFAKIFARVRATLNEISVAPITSFKMKRTLHIEFALFLLGAALIFSVATVHADDEKATVHHRHHAKVEKAQAVTQSRPAVKATGGKLIPTRDGRHSQDTEGNAAGVANGPEYRVPTGSQIPRKYNRRGTTTDSFDNTTIIDQNDQRFQEQDKVSEILRTDPSLQVRGGR